MFEDFEGNDRGLF